MKLIKKIIILVNLILCMFCINVFADTVSVELKYIWEEQEYTATFNVDSAYADNVIISKFGPKLCYVWFCTNEIYVSNGYIKSDGNVLFYQPNLSDMPITGTYNVSRSTSLNSVASNNTILGSSKDIYNKDTGEIHFKSTNSNVSDFDDTTIDWESAFEYYISSINQTENYGYLDGGYSDIVNLFMKPNSLDGLIDNEELHNNNIYYLFKFNVTFKFKQSDGNINMHPLDVSPIMTIDTYYDLEIPYLFGNIAQNSERNIIYDSLNNLTDGYLDKYIVADIIDDSIGLINYDVLVQPYVVKQITYPEYSEEIIYTYDIITVSNDNNSENYVPIKESIEKVVPDNIDDTEKNKIYYIVGPNGEIIDVVDKSVRYDFDEDFNIIDNDTGYPVVRPTINKDTGNFELLDKDGNVVGNSINGNNRPDEETIREETNKKNYYDIGSIINGLKNNLQELVSGDGSLAKMFAWFRQIFEWLPFGILKIFGMIISFFIIFEFIHIIRK